MKNPNWHILLGTCLLVVLGNDPSAALTINPLYPPGTLFSAAQDTAAKAAINAAATDLSQAITNTLTAVTTDAYTGNFGAASATLGFQFQYTDPSTNDDVFVSTATIAAGTVHMAVGTRSLSGDTLGVGGPGFVVLDSAQSTGFGDPSKPNQWPTAVAIASSRAEAAYKRSFGPIIATETGTWPFEGVVANIEVDFGVTIGSLALDADASTNWHFNHLTSVPFGKTDLYSVALHEMVHALGVGTSDTWDSKVVGTNWTGTNVLAVTGSGTNLIDPDGAHIAPNTLSRRITDGLFQEAAMDPDIYDGQRKYLTELDLAFLRDLGYSTVLPMFPDVPGDFDGDGDIDANDLATWQAAYGQNASGDADNDGDSDGRDFLLWQRNYTGTLLTATSRVVPEPSTLAFTLLLTAIGVISRQYAD